MRSSWRQRRAVSSAFTVVESLHDDAVWEDAALMRQQLRRFCAARNEALKPLCVPQCDGSLLVFLCCVTDLRTRYFRVWSRGGVARHSSSGTGVGW